MIKDHKDDFPNRISFPLINPWKLSIDKTSKAILNRINTAARNHTKVGRIHLLKLIGLKTYQIKNYVILWYSK